MKKSWFILLVSVLLLAVFGVYSVYAQDDDGYPVDEPTETETTTPSPTQPAPSDPTETPPADPTEVVTPLPTVVSPEPNPVCDGTMIHPILEEFSIRYDVTYEEVLRYYCELGASVGEISMALKTVTRTDGAVSAADLLEQHINDELGWGEIWQNLGLIGHGNNLDHAQSNGLMRNTEQNEFQEQIMNEGEDDQIQNEAEHQDQNGNAQGNVIGQNEENGKPDNSSGQSSNNGKPDNSSRQSNNNGKPDNSSGQGSNNGH